MGNTEQDGDEDIIESTDVSAKKATESRNEVQKVSEGTLSQKHQQNERARNHKQHEARAEGDERTVSEVTKIGTSKINHEVVDVSRSHSSESQQEVQPRSSAEDKS